MLTRFLLTRCSSFRLGRTTFGLLLFCLLALLPAGARAATFLVTDLNDYDSSNFSATPDTGSLRYAISQAYSAAYTSNSPSVVLFQKGLTGTIHLVVTLNVPAGVIVEGPGGGQIKIDGGASSGNTFPDIDVSLGAQNSAAAISGLTIQNGSNNGSSALPSGVTNLGNGGGILVDNNAALSVTNCTFTGDMASSGNANLGDGGALNGSTGSTVTVTNCTFTGNTANNGGAVTCGADSNSANPTILTMTGCTFTGNTSSTGGAVEVAGGAATLTDCTITGNTANTTSGGYGEGGGVFTGYGAATLVGCTLAYNTAVSGGGGLLSDGATDTLTNCLIVGNSAEQGGGLSGSVVATGCTLTQNIATGYAGYYGAGVTGAATLTNDILYNNTDGNGNVYEIFSDAGGSATNCDIDETVGSGQDDYTGTNNINQNPMFVNPTSSPSALGDFHLQPASPCIGAGATQSGAPTGVTLPTTDLSGAPRSSPPTSGAYEGSELIVNTAADPDNNTGGNGTTLSLREAINQANVLIGPNSNVPPYTLITFDPTVFATAQTITETPSLGTLALNEPMTIQGPAAGVAISGANANMVMAVTYNLYNAPVTLSNLTIEHGYNDETNGSLFASSGGLTNNGVLDLVNCMFTANAATSSASSSGYYNAAGGGLVNLGTVTLTDCTFSNNSASYSGGGFYNGGNATFVQCTLTSNTTGFDGGGIDSYGPMTLSSCTLVGNSALSGGGLENEGNTAFLTNCVFVSNSAADSDGIAGEGGAVYTTPSASGEDQPGAMTTITNCTFTANSVTEAGDGGALFAAPGYQSAGDVTLTNDIFYNDSGGEISTLFTYGETNDGPTPLVTATHCDVDETLGIGPNGDGVTDDGGNLPTNANPEFFNEPTDLHLDPGSPCLSAGTATGAPATDITGLLRPTPPSIGAYEVIAEPASSVLAATTTTAVSDTPNPSAPGQNVTFTVQVAPTSGTGTPTGTVTFTANGVSTPETLNGSGQATFSTTSLPAGTDTVTAAYSGDSAFSSSSVTFTQNVLQATTTTLASSALSGSTVGQSVTFTATVAPASATGTVTFSVNNVAQPAVQVMNGQATFSDSSLTAGSDFITATYSGDANFASSTSSTLTQTVSAATTGGGGGTTTPATLHTFTPGLQMISLTENYGAVSPLSAAWNAPSGQTLFTWNGGPNYLTDSVTSASQLPTPGQGAWLYVAPGQSIAVYDSGQATPTSSPATISLTTGWNLIGNPFSLPVALSGVTVSANSGTYTLAQGNLQALVFTTLYTYPAAPLGSTQLYMTKGLSDSLDPFAGYWMYAFQPCTLHLPAP